MGTQSVEKAYAKFSPVYDLFFGRALSAGRRSGINCMNLQPGHRVLEVGVGTGLSLSAYPNDVRVTGIDISEEMLIKARKRIARKELSNIDELHIMDAQSMSFEDDSFDSVIAMYVMAVVPDPILVVREMCRVCKPGGNVIIVNYFRTGSKKVRLNEWVVKPLGKMFHFHFGLDLDEFTDQLDLDVVDSFRANIFNHTTVLHFRNNGSTH